MNRDEIIEAGFKGVVMSDMPKTILLAAEMAAKYDNDERGAIHAILDSHGEQEKEINRLTAELEQVKADNNELRAELGALPHQLQSILDGKTIPLEQYIPNLISNITEALATGG